MRIHEPKHPAAAIWHAVLLATALIILWFLLNMLSPKSPGRALNPGSATEIALPQRTAACLTPRRQLPSESRATRARFVHT